MSQFCLEKYYTEEIQRLNREKQEILYKMDSINTTITRVHHERAIIIKERVHQAQK